MAKNSSTAGQKVRKEFMKKLSAGKVLCSEINKATNNTKFLYMRRHDAFVSQLESARQSMLTENGRAQKDIIRKLDKYKHRKRSIFRERVLSRREESYEDQEEDDLESSACRSAGTRHHTPSNPSAASWSSRSRSYRRKSSSYSISLHPPSGSSSGSNVLPTILKVPMAEEDTEHINTAIQRQLHQYMRKQEGLQAQILRSRVHEFCSELDIARGTTSTTSTTSTSTSSSSSNSNSSSRRRRQYVGNKKGSSSTTSRRIVFSEGETTPPIPHSAKTRRVVTSCKGNLKVSLPSLA